MGAEIWGESALMKTAPGCEAGSGQPWDVARLSLEFPCWSEATIRPFCHLLSLCPFFGGDGVGLAGLASNLQSFF